jgi:serine/threonine protein kinase/tetratricopeptide (TPR) repeat protein
MNLGWEQAKEIFIRAITLAPDERLSFVERECSGDTELYREVTSLLSSYKEDSFLETPAAAAVADTLLFHELKFSAGQTIGRYEIVGQLGAGGMGEVYLAKDIDLGRKVAIKILNKRFSADASNIERFTREAKAASALNHPNILVIHEIGESDNAKYIVSEFIDGKTIRDLLRGPRMEISTILDFAIQIGGALAAAHGKHIIHRDIKPENVMVRPDGYVKVLDFGLAKLISGRDGLVDLANSSEIQNHTAKGVILGTVNYMSPEQAKGEHVDERTDIFSLGVLIYEMTAGRAPFEGGSLSETLANVIISEPPPLSQYSPDIPDGLQSIVTRSLQKTRNLRYQTMPDMLADLKSLSDDLAFGDRLDRSASTSNKPAPRSSSNELRSGSQTRMFWSGRRIWLATAFTLAVLIFGSISVYYIFSNRSRPSSSLAGRKSLAILPFVNSSGDPNVKYLSDGITDNVINNLSQVSGLDVKSRNSSFRFRGDESDIRAIASKLGVENVITGDIKQLGDRLIINVNLIHAEDDSQIWGNQYIRSSTDIFAVQTEIANAVAQNLKVRLTDTETQVLKKHYTENVEAYQLFLKGQYAWNKHTREDVLKSIEFFNRALEIDPNFGLAYFGLSAAYGVMGNNYVRPRDAFPKAKEYAAKALAIDETLAEAHTGMGAVYLYYDWNWAEADKELERAEALNPDLAQTSLLDGDRLETLGRFDEAKALRRHSLDLEPLVPQFNFVAGATFYFAGQYDDAITQLEKTVELEPRYFDTYLFLGQAYEQKGMYAEAIETYQRAMARGGDGPDLVAALGHVYALQNDRGKAEAQLDELRKMSGRSYISPYWFALVYLGLNDKDKTFEWLEKAFDDRSAILIWLGVEPVFKPLRDDPRFQDLLHRIRPQN